MLTFISYILLHLLICLLQHPIFYLPEVKLVVSQSNNVLTLKKEECETGFL